MDNKDYYDDYKINTDVLKESMKAQGLRTIDLAEKAVIDWAQVKRILNGSTEKPRIDTVIRMCDALKIDNIRDVLEVKQFKYL